MENSIIESIKQNPVYLQILKDSFWWVMYNVANRGKYETKQILTLWEHLTENEKSSVWGIMQWVFNFIQEK